MGLFDNWFDKKCEAIKETVFYKTKIVLVFEDETVMNNEHVSIADQDDVVIASSHLGTHYAVKDGLGYWKHKKVIAVKVIREP